MSPGAAGAGGHVVPGEGGAGDFTEVWLQTCARGPVSQGHREGVPWGGASHMGCP